MKCPRCQSAMSKEYYEAVFIDRCTQCNGAWLDHGELFKVAVIEEKEVDSKIRKEVIINASAGIPKEEVESVTICPKCHSKMYPYNYDYSSGIIIDRCKAGHGVWLDAQELEKVQAHREDWNEQADKKRGEWKELLGEATSEHYEKIVANADRQKISRYAFVSQVIDFIVNTVSGGKS